MNPIETFTHAGLTVEIHYDEDASADSPRTWSNVATIYAEHRNYTLADEDAELPAREEECPKCEGDGWVGDEACERCGGEGEIPRDLAEAIRKEYGARVVLGLWMFEHSGVALRTSPLDAGGGDNPFNDPWDSGMVGLVWDTPEAVRACMGEDVTDEQITRALEQEVETYSQYVNGEVYGYVIRNANGDTLDSLWSMYELDYTEREAKAAAEEEAAAIAHEARERAYWENRGVETVTS